MNKKDLYKQLYYFSMFDGYLENTGKNARLKVTMLIDNIDYINKVACALDEIPLGYSLREPPITGKSVNQTISIQSKTHPILTKIHARLYASGRKALEPHMLTMLDDDALAIVFMTDGSCYMDKRTPGSIQYRLHTNSFSFGDCYLFKKALKEKFDLEFNVDSTGKTGQFNLRLRQSQNELFESIVRPFTLDSFLYKFGR